MSGHNCISLPPMQSGPGAFFGFRCLNSNPTSSLHIGSIKKEFITLAGNYSLYLSPRSGKSDFKTSPVVQKWLIMASDILLLSLMTFPSTNNLFIEVDLDPALGFIMGFRVFHILYTEFCCYQKHLGNNLSPLLSDICGEDFYTYCISSFVVDLGIIVVSYIIDYFAWC